MLSSRAASVIQAGKHLDASVLIPHFISFPLVLSGVSPVTISKQSSSLGEHLQDTHSILRARSAFLSFSTRPPSGSLSYQKVSRSPPPSHPRSVSFRCVCACLLCGDILCSAPECHLLRRTAIKQHFPSSCSPGSSRLSPRLSRGLTSLFVLPVCGVAPLVFYPPFHALLFSCLSTQSYPLTVFTVSVCERKQGVLNVRQ